MYCCTVAWSALATNCSSGSVNWISILVTVEVQKVTPRKCCGVGVPKYDAWIVISPLSSPGWSAFT